MPSSRVPRRLQDIVDNARAIERYTNGMDLLRFQQDRLVYDAVERCMERICEAAVKLGDMATYLMPDQPWRRIRGFGNVLRHEYDSIREDRLFEIATTDVPGLCKACETALSDWPLSDG